MSHCSASASSPGPHISSTVGPHFPLRISPPTMPGAIDRFIRHVSFKKRRHRGDLLDNSIAIDGLVLLPMTLSNTESMWTRMAKKSDEYPVKCDADVDSDKASIDSFSTMATMDNNPGTGRILDTYIYQNLGRRVEKWISHIKLPYLPPETVLQHIIEMFSSNGLDMLDDLWQYSTGSSVDDISGMPFGRDIVYGLKAIIHRANSKSVNERAIALAGLLCLSSHNSFLLGFYSETARTLPTMLQHPKSLGHDSRDTALHGIYKLANMISGSSGRKLPSLCLARRIRSELINRLSARSVKINTLDDICCATGLLLESVRCIGFLDWTGWGNPAVYEIVEAAFYVIVFLIHSFKHACSTTWDVDGVSKNPISAESQRQSELLMSCQLRWFTQLSRLLLWQFTRQGGLRSAESTMLGLTIASLFCGEHMLKLFPNVQEEALAFRSSIPTCFPRRIRSNLFRNTESDSVFQYVCSEADKRAIRLLGSLDSLEKEISHSHSTSKAEYSALHRNVQIWLEINGDPLRSTRRKWLWNSLSHARRARVDEDTLTSDFRQAREPEESESGSPWPYKWRIFQELRESRNSWGKALQIAPDWDSQKKLSQSLRRLFKVQIDLTSVHTGQVRGGVGNDASVLCAEFTVARIPKEMRIVFKSHETGETTLRVVPIRDGFVMPTRCDDNRDEPDDSP